MITIDDLQGHWQRDWIKAPGFKDDTTRVHWLQAGVLFADLRIPLLRPEISGLSCLAELDQTSLLRLMVSEGFAGHITVEDSRCTWHRKINWHGVPGQADIGAMSFDDSGGLIEDGVQADYRELWQAVPQTALRGAKVRSGALNGVLIENDEVFLLGIGPKPQGTSADLIAALDGATADHPALHQHFSSAYVLGRWDGPLGIAQLSTNPFYEGQVTLERHGGLVWHSLAFDGQRKALPLNLS